MEPYVPPSPDIPAENTLLVAEEFMRLLRPMQRASDSNNSLWGFSVLSGIIAILVGSLTSLWLGPKIPIVCTGIFLVLLWALMRGSSAYGARQKPTIARLKEIISDTQGVEMLGPILDFIDAVSHFPATYDEVAPTVDAAILRLLPLITTTDSVSLNTQQRERLHIYMFHRRPGSGQLGLDNLPYARGLINALEQIGDKRDLPRIHRWLQASSLSVEITASLQRCFDIVSVRVAREEGKDFLLRPDSKPESGDTLLRPASGGAGNPPEQLLRASSDDSVPPA